MVDHLDVGLVAEVKLKFPVQYVHLTSIVSISSVENFKKPKLTAVGIRCADHGTSSIH
jgi:hypothetical protein